MGALTRTGLRIAGTTGLTAALLAGVSIDAQERPAVPAFPTQAAAITVDVVVLDSSGRTVLDLRRDEFSITDDGTPQAIVGFEPPALPSAVSPAREASDESSPASATVTAAQPSPRGRIFALVFDDVGIGLLAATDAKKAIASWIEGRVGPGDEVTLLSASGDVFWSGGVGRGRGDLLAAAERLKGRRPPASLWGMSDWEGFQITADPYDRLGVKQRVVQRWLHTGQCSLDPEHAVNNCDPLVRQSALHLEMMRRSRTKAVLDKLARLSEALAAQHGRKAIVLFTEELLRDPLQEPETRRTIEAARRANAALYFVAAGGLRGPSVFSAERAANDSPDPGQIGLIDHEEAFLATGGGEHLADETGGAIVRNTNDLGGGLARAADDSSSYYLLGYQPTAAPDGRWHRIEVKVARPGLKVRARRGYLAAAAPAPLLVPHELALWSALGSPVPPRDFEHASAVLHFQPHGKERELLVLLEVPLAAVRLVRDGDRQLFHARLSALASIRNEAGGAVQSLSLEWPVEGPLEKLAGTRGGRLLLRRVVRLTPGRYTLESAVLDQEDKRISVGRQGFEVPEAAPGLATSSLTLIERTEPAPAAQPTAEDPLVLEQVAFVPRLAGTLPAGTNALPLLLNLYTQPGSGPVELTVDVQHGAETVMSTKPALPPADPQGRIVWIGRLATGQLAPGSYALRATARQGKQLAVEDAAFELPAPAAASLPPQAREPSRAQAQEPAPEPPAPELTRLLERAGRYVLGYEETFRFVVTEEAYTQWVDPPFESRGERLTNRRTRADLVYVKTPVVGACPWTSFRDVFEVDGQKVRGREGRLERLFRGEAFDSALGKAAAILRESARYNIGTAFRTINVPTLPLMFLRPDNQGRFRFARKRTRWFHGVEGVEIEFEERGRPTLVSSIEVHDVPARGRFWIDATRGTILRSETTFVIPPDRARGRVAVDYAPQQDLAIWLPERMTESYTDLSGQPFFKGRTDCTARYSNYRFFTVSTSEKATLPDRE